MLKRNLFAIIIVTLGLVMAVNTFGQDRGKRPSKKNPEINRNDAMIKPMHAEVNEIMIDGTKVWGNEVTITGGKRGNSETSRVSKPKTQEKLGNFEIQMVKSPRDVASGQATQRTKPNSQEKLGNFEIQDLKTTPKQVQPGQNSGGTISNQRTKSNSQNKLGNFEIQDIKSPRDVATGQVMNKNCQEFESVRSKKSSNIQSLRDVASGQATGKRQHKP